MQPSPEVHTAIHCPAAVWEVNPLQAMVEVLTWADTRAARSPLVLARFPGFRGLGHPTSLSTEEPRKGGGQ